LKTAIVAGVAYVDVEHDAPYLRELLADAREHQCRTILSYHNFESTPSKEELSVLVANMQTYHPDYLKIVPFAQSPDDALRVLLLYENTKNLLSFCMGEQGKYSRIVSYLLGAPFIYAASKNGAGTADGQLTVAEIKAVLQLLR